MSATTVIVGSSVAGVRTAQALRAAGFAGDVVLIGEETALPYDKPPLSKALLAGTATVADIVLLSRQEAAEAGIKLRLGHAATRLDVAERSVHLSDGSRLRFDDLVIATGAKARPSPWGSPPGVHVLRTLDDALALGNRLRHGGRLVVVGAGFIGAEVAATACALGLSEVTVVDPMPVPLSRVLSPEVAVLFGRLHRARGVVTRFGVAVTGIDRSPHGLAVRLGDGTALSADTVVVGIGATPNDEWLRDSGVRTDDGVLCDEFSRSVSDPHVHAVGDVARWRHPRYGRLLRVEHWTNAVEQASCVAHNIAHPDDPRRYAPVEYVWSDQYDWKIQLVGRTGGDLVSDRIDGADPDRSFAVLYAGPDGRFAGAVAVNWPRAQIAARRALASGAALAEVREAIASDRKTRQSKAIAN